MALHKEMAMLSQLITTWFGLGECKAILESHWGNKVLQQSTAMPVPIKHQRKVKFQILLYRKIYPLVATVNLTDSRI